MMMLMMMIKTCLNIVLNNQGCSTTKLKSKVKPNCSLYFL